LAVKRRGRVERRKHDRVAGRLARKEGAFAFRSRHASVPLFTLTFRLEPLRIGVGASTSPVNASISRGPSPRGCSKAELSSCSSFGRPSATARGVRWPRTRRSRNRGERVSRDKEELDLDKEWIELLNERRVVLPGVQVLFAFLLAAPFSQRFGAVTDVQKNAYSCRFCSRPSRPV
jgi:hypothetical protein